MNYHYIEHDNMLNGDGLRVILWVAGCGHNCPSCQNPETHDPTGGKLFDEQAKQEIFEQLSQDYINGITFSGGDPLYPGNRQVIGDLIKEIKEKYPSKNIWLYTGFLWEQIKDLDFIPLVDVICEGPFVLSKKHNKLKWVGSTNQRIIDVKNSKEQVKLYEENLQCK